MNIGDSIMTQEQIRYSKMTKEEKSSVLHGQSNFATQKRRNVS